MDEMGRRPGVSVANEQSKSRKIRLKTIEDPKLERIL